MAETYLTITSATQALLNDSDAQLYSPAFLMRYVNLAQARVAARLRAHKLDRFRLQTILSITAGMTVVDKTTNPALPADFVEPIVLAERAAGEGNDRWVSMVQDRESLPARLPSERLVDWVWSGNAIRFVGSTAAREVKIDYRCSLTPFATSGDTVPILETVDVIATKAAELVCESNGAAQEAERFRRDYEEGIADLLAIGITQRRPRRQRPYLGAYPRVFPRIT